MNTASPASGVELVRLDVYLLRVAGPFSLMTRHSWRLLFAPMREECCLGRHNHSHVLRSSGISLGPFPKEEQ